MGLFSRMLAGDVFSLVVFDFSIHAGTGDHGPGRGLPREPASPQADRVFEVLSPPRGRTAFASRWLKRLLAWLNGELKSLGPM